MSPKSKPDERKPLAVTVKDACRISGLGNTTLWRLIKEGKVSTVQIGRRRLVTYRSLEALVAPLKKTGT